MNTAKQKRDYILKKATALYYDLRNKGIGHAVAFRAVVDLILNDREISDPDLRKMELRQKGKGAK